MKTSSIILRSIIILVVIASGCAGSQPNSDTRREADLFPYQEAAMKEPPVTASERETESIVIARSRTRGNDADLSSLGLEPDDDALGGIAAAEKETRKSAGMSVAHPFYAMRTATTSATGTLRSEKAGRDSPAHAFSPTGTATVSEAAPSVRGYPASDESAASESASEPPASVVHTSGDGVIFNFDNADIHEVINTISEILGFNYIVDPRISGKVNINTKEKIAKEDLFPVLETLLKVNNATIVKKGNLYHILPLPAVKHEAIRPDALREQDLPDSDKFIIQVVRLEYISADEMANILKPFVSPQGGEVIPKDTILMILDFSANVKKLMSLIDLFDVGMFERLHVQLYEAKYADVEELATELDTVFKAFELPADTARAGGITFVPVTRLNMLMAVSANQVLLDKAMQWVEKMDTEVSETALRIFVYYVQNGKAEDIYNVLIQVFQGEAPPTETAFKSQLRETPTTKGKEKQKPRVPQRPKKVGETVEEITGEVEFVVDERNNAIIVKASERDYRVIQKTIKKLDIYPKQVLIEVLIAEIRLDDELEMGVEWWYKNTFDRGQGDYRVDVTGITGPLAEEISGGLAYVIQKTDRFYAEIRALAAKDRVNILSSPHVIASDNKEAVINITEEIPIASGSVTTTTAEPVITETIEYRDTGIILKVTPHINDRGLVSLHVSQEVSEQSTRVSTGTDNPIFLKRSAETDMVVQNGQSVIIGGLIRESRTTGKSGVPVLSSIPVIGFLFGYNRDATNRSELMFLLTPHVVTSIEEADAITKEFKNKLSIIEEQNI